jgi:eukaryotic-like serine/threonine-protein kinase
LFASVETAAEPRKLSEGTMLDDKYRIDRLLAVGGMGAVYVGTHIKLRKRVAIKVLNPQLSSAAMIERFHREAITASQIGHEGIAQVTDIGTSSDGEPFLVMEYLEGEPLASRLRTSGPLSIEDACELGCSILSPLAAAHRAGIIHRDLKPDNVFLVRQSRGELVKLLDFGISRAAGLESEFRLTTTGLVLGTPYYMSPEQARGDSAITPAADLYAFGVILYEMLTGSVPIRADNYNQLMYRVMIGDYARPRERRPDLPEALERIILQSMALEPEHRPASAVDLEAPLLAYCRPAFRDRSSSRMSAPGLPLPTPAPATASGSGIRRSGVGTDHTAIASGAPVPGFGAPLGTAGAITNPRRPAARRSRLPWILAAIVVAAGIAAVVVVAGHGDGQVAIAPAQPAAAQPAAAQPAAAQPAAAQPAAAQPATAPAQPAAPATADVTSPAQPQPQAAAATPDNAATAAPAAATVTLRFAVEPAGATILVDGTRVQGSELVVPRDDRTHTLRITAPGRLAHDETVRFDESQRLEVQLKRAGSARGNGPRDHSGSGERIDVDSPY